MQAQAHLIPEDEEMEEMEEQDEIETESGEDTTEPEEEGEEESEEEVEESEDEVMEVQEAPPVRFHRPTFHDARRNRRIDVVNELDMKRPITAYLMKDTDHASKAYLILPLEDMAGSVVHCEVYRRDREFEGLVFREADQRAVVKRVNRWPLPVHENPYNEVAIMREYGDNEHVIECYEALKDAQNLYVVTLSAGAQNLEQQNLGPDEKRTIMKRLLENLQYMHEHQLVHRDLNLNNYIVDMPSRTFMLKTFAQTLQQRESEQDGTILDISAQGNGAGSPHFLAPELHLNQSFNDKADIWSLGCILWRLLTGLHLYDAPTPADRSYLVLIEQAGLHPHHPYIGSFQDELNRLRQENENGDHRARMEAAATLPPEARELLARLIHPNPDLRPTSEEVLQHPFFQPRLG